MREILNNNGLDWNSKLGLLNLRSGALSTKLSGASDQIVLILTFLSLKIILTLEDQHQRFFPLARVNLVVSSRGCMVMALNVM